MKEELPVYVFTGFLDAGKTNFIKNALMDPDFNNGERMLVLACEDGEEQYDTDAEYMENVSVVYIDDEDDLTVDRLTQITMQYNDIDSVMVEYNGMWKMETLYKAVPDNWLIYQVINLIDATNFMSYNNMFRNLMVDKLASCELTIFNRCVKNGFDMEMFHKIVRAVSRKIQISYEYTDGTCEMDNIPDPLPFDKNADYIEIGDDDYALWFRDLAEDPRQYHGKIVKLLALAIPNTYLKEEGFGLGRQVMTCCVEDTKFMGMLCYNMPKKKMNLPGWYRVEAKIKFEYNKIAKKKIPVFYAINIDEAAEPEEPIATFY